MELLIVGAVSFLRVFLRAVQQLNVVGSHYKLAFFVSYLMTACELYVVMSIVIVMDWSLFLPIGTGSAIGGVTGMFIHKKYVRGRNGKTN